MQRLFRFPVVGWAFFAACNSAPLPPGNAPGPAEGTLSPDALHALAADSITAVAEAVVAVAPVYTLQAIFEDGQPPPTCPTLDVAPAGGELQLDMNYGPGCSSEMIAGPRFAGRVTGTSFPAHNAFDLALLDLTVNADPLDGSVSGSYTPGDHGAAFYAGVRIATPGGTRIRGQVQLDLDRRLGSLIARSGRLSIMTPDDARYDADLKEVIIDTANGGALVPTAGAVTLQKVSAVGRMAEPTTVSFGN